MLNKRSVAFKISAIIMVGLAVSVISIGSLINFHQYKIWGKPLIREFDGIKRENDKSGKTLQVQQVSVDHANFLTTTACLNNAQTSELKPLFAVSLVSNNQDVAMIDHYLGFIATLRAPPAI